MNAQPSGRVVQPAVIPHSCWPGWTWKPISEGMTDLHIRGGKGGRYGVPPTAQQYPKGTVWACDCGRHWLSTGRDPWTAGPGWRPETRRERRRRLGLRWWQKGAR
jgi:hypothetical protein